MTDPPPPEHDAQRTSPDAAPLLRRSRDDGVIAGASEGPRCLSIDPEIVVAAEALLIVGAPR